MIVETTLRCWACLNFFNINVVNTNLFKGFTFIYANFNLSNFGDIR